MDIKNYNEVAIIEESKKDPKAFEAIYNRYFDQIFHFIGKRLKDEETAFDIVQQVFFKALTHLGSYKHKGSPFSSFLYRIAINECNQHFRASKNIRHISIDETSVNPISDNPISGSEDHLLPHLTKALQKLKNEELFLIELRFFEQRSIREVAEMNGISENNCKVKLHRVIKKLRKEVKHEE